MAIRKQRAAYTENDICEFDYNIAVRKAKKFYRDSLRFYLYCDNINTNVWCAMSEIEFLRWKMEVSKHLNTYLDGVHKLECWKFDCNKKRWTNVVLK